MCHRLDRVPDRRSSRPDFWPTSLSMTPMPSVRQAAHPFHQPLARPDGGPALDRRSGFRRLKTAQNRRAAAEALGRIGDKSAVPTLLKVAGGRRSNDPILWHSCTYALIEIADPTGTAAGLTVRTAWNQPRGARGARPDGSGRPEAAQVVPFLTTPDAKLREAASWVVGRHPAWAAPLAGFLRDRLQPRNALGRGRAGTLEPARELRPGGPVQELLVRDAPRFRTSRASVHRVALQAMADPA